MSNRLVQYYRVFSSYLYTIPIRIFCRKHIKISPIQLWGSFLDIKCINRGKIHIGRKLFTRSNTHLLADGGLLEIDNYVFLNHNVSITALEHIHIESNVTIANNVVIVDHDHGKNRGEFISSPVHIKNGAWIGANAVILKGVTIGENAVVAAGAVVNRSVPANTTVYGVPATPKNVL